MRLSSCVLRFLPLFILLTAIQTAAQDTSKPTTPDIQPSSRTAAEIGPLYFNYHYSSGPFVRIMSGTVEDVPGLWNALVPLQPPPGAKGGYGMIGDDRLLGEKPGYGLVQLGRVARQYITFDRLHVEQPSGWETIGVQSGVFTNVDEMSDATLGWTFFDVRGSFETDLKKLLNSHP